MALIGKIRQKTGILLGFIGLSLLIFLLQEAISSNNNMGGVVKSVGKINGKKVDAVEYFDEVNRYENRIKTLNPEFELNERNSLAIREEIWNNFVFNSAVGKTIEKLGLSVTPNELSDAFKGKNLSPLVMNIIGQYFVNPQTGMFDKAQMENSLNNLDKVDPMLRQIVIELEPLVAQERVKVKYASLVSKSAYVPTFIAKENIEDQKMATADILNIPYFTVLDDEINISDEEIQNYIKSNPAKYKRSANVVMDLVSFEIRPSIEDHNDLIAQLQKVKEELQTTDDDSLYIARSSVQGGLEIYQSADQIRQSGRTNADSIINAPVGTFIGPSIQGDALVLSYIADRKMVADSVRASNIILAVQNPSEFETKKQLAEKIVADIKSGAASFEQKVAEFSEDNNSKQLGGDLGYFAQGSIDPELNRKLFFEMSVGQVEIIETQSAIFIMKKTEQTPLRLATRVVDFANELAASDATSKGIYNDANQFWTSSKTAKDFDENAKSKRALKGLTVTTKDIEVGAIPGSRSIISWAFKEGKAGDVNFFDLSDRYVVVKISAKNEAGLANPSEVKNEVVSVLSAAKKAEIIKKKLGDTKNASLDALAQKVSGNVIAGKVVQYSSPYVEEVGVEPKLIGAIFGVKPGQQSNPIEGYNGVFVVKTLSVEPLAGNVDVAAYKSQLFRQNSSQLGFDKIFGTILKSSEVEDLRYMVY